MEAKQSSVSLSTGQSTLERGTSLLVSSADSWAVGGKEPLLAIPPLSPSVLIVSENHEAAHKEIRAEGPGRQRK